MQPKCRGLITASFSLLGCLIVNNPTKAEDKDTDYFSLSLEELASIKVVTSSRREQTVDDSYANISVITKDMLDSRGYRNLIEVLQDLPGFDFSTFEDGGGEYPTHFLNRGIGGDNGNTRLLVMVDGFVQNHISFNWSQGLTDEQILQDIERIEVVQGPGSALYGAQAVSGIVHIITRKGYEGTQLKATVAENSSRTLEAFHGSSLAGINYQVAVKSHKSDGDSGNNRPDPGNYFHNNVYPNYLTQNYDENGNYVTNSPHPLAGRPIADGFNTSKDDKAVRLRVSKDNLQIGLNYWDKKDGLGSYVVGYEYEATAEDFITHHSSTSVFIKNQFPLVEKKLSWKTDFWYRVDQQESDTGFRYTYRFPDLKKSYHSASSQIGFENQVDWQISENETAIFGLRFLGNRQTEQVVSLGRLQNGNASTTDAAWDIAASGEGLYQPKVNEIFDESETAFYFLFESEINSQLSYSLGARYSDGSDYGSTTNPRAGVIYRPANDWIIKALYGSAFRQPSLFELRDEFRGYEELKPEEIDSFELELTRKLSPISQAKLNLFYSNLEDSISLISDPSRAGGERYANVSSSKVRGLSGRFDLQPEENLNFYLNYFYQQGTDVNGNWGSLSHTAEHKLNVGINWQPFGNNFNFNLRGNIVGDRTTPITNQYFDGTAPGYEKFNLTLSWLDIYQIPGLSSQLIVKNIFDEDFYGIGRQAGSSDRSTYDPAVTADPPGFIPPYHPQPGRTIHWNISYRIQ
ncbi:TonB-dependent siderophore receptor [Aliikangiella sp. G2MR2-5]|uniref:TonB-dependent receptor plug domain-containing protein n=1 Tax=Aliikangiella sp. G2MR2-5 TaxID=2788943 RepID=UPI0018AC856C|nr:TonB-dependent receptor [Aliikangiella sp. G2MR2-5]